MVKRSTAKRWFEDEIFVLMVVRTESVAKMITQPVPNATAGRFWQPQKQNVSVT
jgi:hypothetical protein